jgi:hypothetical protein
LLTQAHWDQATIGGVLTVSGLIGIALHALAFATGYLVARLFDRR